MATPKVIVFAGYGLNREEEAKYAFEHVGAKADVVHINDLIEGVYKLSKYQIMYFPGGFSYGDDTGSGNAYANRIKNHIFEDVKKFAEADKLIFGICNGFQIMTNLGLLPGFQGELGVRKVALRYNASARFQCRWIDLKAVSKKCVFTKDIETMHLPTAHGEGNFYADDNVLDLLEKNDQVVFQYIKPNGDLPNGEFPYNPNGAIRDIAGICDETGKIFGLMPHPEANLFFTNSDDFPMKKEILKRHGKELPKEGEGIAMFRNAVEWFK